jgi:hypothetical protein
MTFDVHLNATSGEGDDWVRAVDFRVGSGKWARMLPAVDNRLAAPTKVPAGWSPISEVYARITLEKLREIDGDTGRQAEFIRRNLTPIGGTAGVAILKVLLPEDQNLDPKDVEYLGHLLPPPNCSLATVPLLYRYRVSEKGRIVEGRAIDDNDYLPFAKEFIATCTSVGTKTLGLSLPVNIPHSKIPTLVAAYKDVKMPVAVIDGAGGNLDGMNAQIRALLGSKKVDGHSLRQRCGEDFALYAFDTKPYRGRKDIVAAVNLLLVDRGFSAFGRRHTIHMKLPPIPAGSKPAPRPGRIAFPTELAYARDSVPEAVAFLKKWWAARGGDPTAFPGAALSARRAFEQEALAGAAYRLGKWAADGALKKRLEKRSWIQPDLVQARRSNALTGADSA